MTIVTRERMQALCHLNRWRGWTTRPYSVGEHVAVGAFVMDWFKRPDKQVAAWWMHDMHETEIMGDIPTPDKDRYMGTSYFNDVEDFDIRLGDEMNLPQLWWRSPKLKGMDYIMLQVEYTMLVTLSDHSISPPDYDSPFVEAIRNAIGLGVFSDPEKVISYYNKKSWKYGWGEI